MPTIVTHGFVATLLGKSFAAGQMPARFCIPGTIIAAAVLSLRKLRRLRASPAAE